MLLLVLLAACAADYAPSERSPAADYEEMKPTTILTAPAPANVSELERPVAEHGAYLVELLGCGVCHTHGALVGKPDPALALAGSRIGIAYANPLGDRYPAIAYPPNLTPDKATGIGNWNDAQIAIAIQHGRDVYGRLQAPVMPWPGYQKLHEDDVAAIVRYLKSLEPVSHEVPANVPPGMSATAPFVYFGVYRSTDDL
jgi:mono/diheme cytochrome c family protein